MRKRPIIISTLCLLVALPGGTFAETNEAQTPQSIKVETGKQVKAAVNSTSIAALSEDISGPVLESATGSPTQVEVGDSITITARASDESGVAEVIAYLNLPNGLGYKELPLTLDNETGEWKGTYTITDLDPEGTWIIDFDLYDTLGNPAYGEPIDPIQVVNPNGDSTFPTLEGVVISSLNIGVNEEFTIRAKVNDDKGVDTVYATIKTADSVGFHYLPLTFDESTNEWVLTHKFSENDRPGSWYIDIEMTDIAGNYDWVPLDEVLVLSNPFGDFTGPAIGEAAVTPESASPGESVQISVPVSDEQSGVNSVYAEVFHVDSPFDIKYVYLTLDPNTGQWVGDFNIESGLQSGVWNVFIRASDNVGNTSLKEYAGSFDVTNNDGDFDAPIFSSAEVTPQGDVNIGESVTFTAKVSDNVGVDSVYANIYTQAGNEEQFLMSYDAENDQWVGNLEILETTDPGFYMVYYTAYDTALNVNWEYASGGFTVVNPEGDHTGPVISAVELDKTDVNAGEQVTISATVTDTESEVAEVTAYYYDNESIALTFDNTLNKWVGSITIPKNVPDGEVIKINLVNAVDSKGNSTTLYDAGSFQVHNPDGDFILPVVESFEMTPSTVTPGQTVHFEAKLVDDKSGIKSATVYLYNDTDPNITMIDLIDSGENDVWTADYVIPATNGLGTYSVGLGIDDNAGNMADYVADQNLLVKEADTTAPVAPTVEEITDKTTEVSGTTEADAEVTIKVGDTVIGSGKADGEGKFSITIAPQAAGSTIIITAKDQAGNESTTEVVTLASYNSVKVQLNGQDFAQGGYSINKVTHVNWKALETLGIPHTDKGNGQFDIEGRSVQAVSVKGDWYIQWGQLSPGKVLAKAITGGFDFIYAPYPPVKLQLNGEDFAQGGYSINGSTHVNWNALKTLGIPHTDKGNGQFDIEGRSVQAVSVKGDWYIQWGQLSPGKVLAKAITGGFDFIYAPYPPVKLQLNGEDFAQGGYSINGSTHVNWNALKTLGIPHTDKGNGQFDIEGRSVQAVSVKGDWYIQWGQLSPGKVLAKAITGGFDFIYAPYPPVKVQLDGKDFAQGGYRINNATHVNWNALTTLGIPHTDKGNGQFDIEGRSVQAVSVSGDWYIQWGQLSPGKITYKAITGGFDFKYAPYPPVKVQINGKDFAQGGYRIDGSTYVNWNALTTLGISHTDKGDGQFDIEGRSVQAVLVNGDWYIQWGQLSPGKVLAKVITGGFDFIYSPYPPVKVQLNGVDFAQGGYSVDGSTRVNWNALTTLGIPHTDQGNGQFEIEGRTVQAVSVNGDWYIHWNQLSPGKISYQKISGGYDFIYNP